MKKLLTGILTLGLSLSLFACSKSNSSTPTTTKDSTTTERTTYRNDKEKNLMPRIDIVSNDGKTDFATVPTRTNKWDYTDCTVSVKDGSELKIDSVAAGVKVRGNWTTEYPKKPLRIKFDKKQSILGLNEGQKFKSWLLLAAFKDWSMLRDATAFEIAKILGNEYSSDYKFVNVYINNQYWGVYLLCEQQEVKDGRVSITEVEKNYEGTDIGYFLEFDGYYDEEPELETFEINYKTLTAYNGDSYLGSKFQKGFTIKSDIYSQAQNTFIKNYMQTAFDICYEAIYNNNYYEFTTDYQDKTASALTNSKDVVSKVVDIDSIVNTYILSEIACDTDLAWSSFFMDVDFGANGDKKLRFEAPWDFDSSFGNTLGCVNAEGLYAANIFNDVHDEPSANPWLLLFMKADWFRKLVKDKWTSLIEAKAFDSVLENIKTISTTYEGDFIENYNKWDNLGNKSYFWIEFDKSEAGRAKTYMEAVKALSTWLTKRINNLTQIFNTF